jgi:hypothetical protein
MQTQLSPRAASVGFTHPRPPVCSSTGARRGDKRCRAITARLVEGELLILDSAPGSIKGCRHVGKCATAKRKRDALLELAREHVRKQTRVAQLLGQTEVHRRGRGPVPALRLERERRQHRQTHLPRRADGVVLAMFVDVVAGIVFSWARLVAKESTVDGLLHRLRRRRDVEKPVPGRRLVDGANA